MRLALKRCYWLVDLIERGKPPVWIQSVHTCISIPKNNGLWLLTNLSLFKIEWFYIAIDILTLWYYDSDCDLNFYQISSYFFFFMCSQISLFRVQYYWRGFLYYKKRNGWHETVIWLLKCLLLIHCRLRKLIWLLVRMANVFLLAIWIHWRYLPTFWMLLYR